MLENKIQQAPDRKSNAGFEFPGRRLGVNIIPEPGYDPKEVLRLEEIDEQRRQEGLRKVREELGIPQVQESGTESGIVYDISTESAYVQKLHGSSQSLKEGESVNKRVGSFEIENDRQEMIDYLKRSLMELSSDENVTMLVSKDELNDIFESFDTEVSGMVDQEEMEDLLGRKRQEIYALVNGRRREEVARKEEMIEGGQAMSVKEFLRLGGVSNLGEALKILQQRQKEASEASVSPKIASAQEKDQEAGRKSGEEVLVESGEAGKEFDLEKWHNKKVFVKRSEKSGGQVEKDWLVAANDDKGVLVIKLVDGGHLRKIVPYKEFFVLNSENLQQSSEKEISAEGEGASVIQGGAPDSLEGEKNLAPREISRIEGLGGQRLEMQKLDLNSIDGSAKIIGGFDGNLINEQIEIGKPMALDNGKEWSRTSPIKRILERPDGDWIIETQNSTYRLSKKRP